MRVCTYIYTRACACVYLHRPIQPPIIPHAQERDAHLGSSAYPSVLANIGGCFLMGLMYESRVRDVYINCVCAYIYLYILYISYTHTNTRPPKYTYPHSSTHHHQPIVQTLVCPGILRSPPPRVPDLPRLARRLFRLCRHHHVALRLHHHLLEPEFRCVLYAYM